MNNSTPHLKSLKNQNRRAALGRPAMKLLGGGSYWGVGWGFNWFAVDQPSPLVLLWFLRHLVVWFAFLALKCIRIPLCGQNVSNYRRSLGRGF